MADKYINSDTAINEAICAVYWALNQHGNVNGQVIIDKFNAIPSIDIPQWISVKERLPDFEGAVLCMCKSHIRKGGKEIRYQKIMYFDIDEQWFSDENDVFVAKDAVTHWMRLPMPPKEETDG